MKIGECLQFFDSKIVERGRNYYKNGYVVEIEELTSNDYNAIVMGSDIYAVNVVLTDDREIYTHQCNCPYDSGPICKHKVAVLLEIEDHLLSEKQFPTGNLHRIKSALEEYSKQELSQLIISLAKSNLSTRKNLLLLLGLGGQ